MHAELGMYPFDSVAWAWDALWEVVHSHARWTPPTLTRSGDVHARWVDPQCVVTQVCGFPLAARHAKDFRVVGAFELSIAEAAGHSYRSVLLSTTNRPLAELASPTTHAVANRSDSLSGWVSLVAATVGPTGRWPGRATFTSAHVESLRVLRRGQADLAALDSWSLAFIERDEPDLLTGLHRVGLGPLVPTPAITTRVSVDDADHAVLAHAFREAVVDRSIGDALAALHITGFAPLTIDDYLPTLALSTTPHG